ncbi:phosphotransferase [Streptomyces sp. NPDC090022]|uniref:phosphotransferase n=1 Tax=Streptomyces sp. NPDC090022 TaxID=3365920 RepID=UPI00382D0568
MFPYPVGARYPSAQSCSAGVRLSARNLARAYEFLQQAGQDPHGRYLLGLGLNGMAKEVAAKGLEKEAVATAQVALLVLEGAGDYATVQEREKIERAVAFGRAILRNNGGMPVREVPPHLERAICDLAEIIPPEEPGDVAAGSPVVTAPAGSPGPGGPIGLGILDPLDEPLGTDVGDEPDEAAAVHVDLPPSSSASPSAVAVVEESGPESTRDLVHLLSARWTSDRAAVEERSEALFAYFDEVSGHHGGFGRELGRHYREDVRAVAELLPQGLPTERAELHNFAQDMRGFAGKSKILEERRRRWLISATANHWMWRMPNGFPTNRPQVLNDLVGYLRSFTNSDLKYLDSARDLILDCAEILVRVAHEVPPVFLDQYGRLREFALESVGTWLSQSGPNPVLPQDSDRDPRVNSRGADGRPVTAYRVTWPEILLRHWQNADDRNGACFALASVAGWDETCAHWLIDTIFDRSTDPRRDTDREAWTRDVSALMAAAGKVRIANNPWAYESTADFRSTAITSDSAGRLRIPSPVLQAAVAQGLSPGQVVTVHGKLFEGRRMPTYLLTNRYGPQSVLKVDQRDKVLREVRNFTEYAERLHPNNRPSKCESHAMEMYLGDNGEPMRAIETAYAFEEGEVPHTLSGWIRTASPERAVKVIDRLLLTNMRPWLAHSRRDRLDLRAEYPVFRPAPAPNKQSPSSWAATEMAALANDDVRAALGMPLDPSVREATWAASAPGLKKAMGCLPGVEAVNPLWFATELAERGGGAFEDIINSFRIGLLDFDTTLALSHGDLHLDNVLCTLGGELPKPVLIDFESAHYGHVCKDFARLEASLLCQVFTWDEDAAARIASWVAEPLARTVPAPPEAPDLLPRVPKEQELTANERLVLEATRKIREVAVGCGQGHWPIEMAEYHLALAGALIPMVRYSTMEVSQRQFALTLSTVVTSALWHRWSALVTEGS